MAISKTLLNIRHTKSRCILCDNAMHRVTIGNLCNSCKDVFAVRFTEAHAREFAM